MRVLASGIPPESREWNRVKHRNAIPGQADQQVVAETISTFIMRSPAPGYDNGAGDVKSMSAFGERRASETEAGNGGDSPLAHRFLVTSGSTVPASAPALLVGDPPAQTPAQHVARLAGRFPEGPPGGAADQIAGGPAIAQLEGLRRRGAAYLILPVDARGWWAERPDLRSHVEGRYRLLVEDDACRVFDLRRSPIAAFLESILPPGEPVIAILGEHAELDLVGRRVYHLEALAQIDVLRSEGVRFLVLADMSPWAPADAGIVQALERRFRKLVTRPGLCEVFDVSADASNRPESKRGLFARVFGDG